jgi:hypothetical protein
MRVCLWETDNNNQMITLTMIKISCIKKHAHLHLNLKKKNNNIILNNLLKEIRRGAGKIIFRKA